MHDHTPRRHPRLVDKNLRHPMHGVRSRHGILVGEDVVMTGAPRDAIGLSDRLRSYEGRDFETTACYNGLRDEAATALDALQARVKELEANMEYQARAHSKLVNELEEDRVSGWNRCREAESQRDVAKAAADTLRQQRDEAYERAAEEALAHVSEPGLSDNPAYIHFEPSDMMARKIAAAIRRLAAGTEKENPHASD